MKQSVVFYVSGHGYGHAIRTAEVIRLLVQTYLDIQVEVRTSAPLLFFQHLAPQAMAINRAALDAGVVEEDGGLRVDGEKTIAQVRALHARIDERIAEECRSLRTRVPRLIVCDVPYFAADIGEALGVPVLGIGNFLWDWIYQPMAGESAELIERIRASYAKLAGFLRLPFSHDMTAIRQVQDVPLIARRSDKHPDEILEALDLPGDSRPRVLYALRSGIYDGIVERAAASLPDWIFLSTTANAANTLGNLRPLPLGTQLTFADVLGISDIVIGKLGYGIVSETVAHRGARLLWLRRSGFREDEILESQIGRYSACREFPFDDFRRAAWTSHLQATLEVAAPTESLPPDGAGQCAEIVRSWLER